MKPTTGTARNGFTLVEILIAIGIFSLVIAAIYACWSAVLRSSKVGLDAAARAQRTRMAVQSVEEALTYARMHAANADLYWFEGESGSDAMLSFVAKLPKSFPRGGKFGDLTLRRVEFSLQPGEGYSLQMVLRQAPLLMDFDEDEENHPLVLARDVEEMEVGFWDAEEEVWLDDWTETNRIPELVRLSLVTRTSERPGGRKLESTIVVKPASAAVQGVSQASAPPPLPGQQPGAPPGQQPGVQPGGPPGRQPGQQPGVQPGGPPGRQPGPQPGFPPRQGLGVGR